MLKIGDIVTFRPRPTYGLDWDAETLRVGVEARISDISNVTDTVYVQRRQPDGSFNDCHWAARDGEVDPA
jgi:hypothetical protein